MRKSLATIQVRTLKEYSVPSRICVTQYSEVHNRVETSAMSDSGHKTILSIPFFLIYCIAIQYIKKKGILRIVLWPLSLIADVSTLLCTSEY